MIEEIVKKQRAFFNANSTKEISFRLEQLKKVKYILKNGENELFEAIYKDFGKSLYEAYETEFSLLYHELNTAIRNLKRWSRRKTVCTNLANLPSFSYIYPEPLGNVLVIGPWNYPIQLAILPLISAIAAGNTVIVKPSELCLNTSSVMTKLFNAAFPENYVKFIEGGISETSELLKLRFDKIFFTGSVEVGRIVYQAAAKFLTPVVLELGGKSPAFILEDCDIATAAQRIVWGKFLNSGQTCIAPDYLYVHANIEEKFTQELRKQIQLNFDFGAKLPENYVQIINQRNFNRLLSLIDPNKVTIGGESNAELRIIQPTVLRNVSWEDAVMKEEIFGPILPILTFTNINEAISAVKKQERPLALYVFSRSCAQTKKIISEISFGGGAINDTIMHFSNSKLPFGGVGNSGIGSYHGRAGFEAFSHHKSVLKKLISWEPFVKYKPYTNFKLKILRWIFEL